MKLLYQNYNSVYLCEENNQKVVKKKFKNKFCWENETKVIKILESYNLPIPKIINVGYLENTYSFIEKQTFDTTLKSFPEKVDILIELQKEFSRIHDDNLHHFDDRDKSLLKYGNKLLLAGKIDKLLFDKLNKISENYKLKVEGFVHGDFRPSNIFGLDKVEGLIDFEFSGMDDPNQDLAYLWVESVSINKELNHYLKQKFKSLNYFNPHLFDFWLSYIHIMVLSNPNTRLSEAWIKNLEQILG